MLNLDKALERLRNESIVLLPIVEALSDFDVYIVGGSVRDAIMGVESKDIDLVTNALPDEVLDCLSKCGIESIPRGVSFGVVVARMGNVEYEIASFRKDKHSGSGDNREDIVELGVSLGDDLDRRDFTINAMVYDVKNHTLIDNHNGISDIESNTLRSVGDSNRRFAEDNSRKLRAIRFACKYDMTISEEIRIAIINDKSLNCKREIIISELDKMFSFNAQMASVLLDDLGLTSTILDGVDVKKEKSGNTFDLSSYFASRIVESKKNLDIAMNIIQYRYLRDRIESFWMTSEESFYESLLKGKLQIRVFMNLESKIDLNSLLKYGSYEKFSFFYEEGIHRMFKEITKEVIEDGYKATDIGLVTNGRMIDRIKRRLK